MQLLLFPLVPFIAFLPFQSYSDSSSSSNGAFDLERFESKLRSNVPAPRVLFWDPERARYPLCRVDAAMRRNIPQFSAWLHTLAPEGVIWDGPKLFAQYARARNLSAQETKPDDHIMIVEEFVVSGVRLFNQHPKMNVGKFIFRHVVFQNCLFIEDCFCGVSFYSCLFKNCIFVMPNWGKARSRNCLRRCSYQDPIVIPVNSVNARAEFMDTARMGDGVLNGNVIICSTLTDAMRRLSPDVSVLYNQNTRLFMKQG